MKSQKKTKLPLHHQTQTPEQTYAQMKESGRPEKIKRYNDKNKTSNMNLPGFKKK